MPSTSIACGTLLILIGILGAIAAQLNGKPFKTALIPAAFGILLAACGLLAWKMNSMRKHLMHAALLVALLGFIGSLASPGVWKLITTGQIGDQTSLTAQLSMAAVCIIFVILGIKSFVDARRKTEV